MTVGKLNAWSWRHAVLQSGLPPTTRHVLLTLSCFMNEIGGGCYPTQDQLAEATGLTARSVRKQLDIALGVVLDDKGRVVRDTEQPVGPDGKHPEKVDPDRVWVAREEHGFRGQKWRNHQYRAVWPSAFAASKGAEPNSAPSAKGAESRSGKVRNGVPTNSPRTIPETADAVSTRGRAKPSVSRKPRNVIEAARAELAREAANAE